MWQNSTHNLLYDYIDRKNDNDEKNFSVGNYSFSNF